jgi:pimeloyl-ACP methyl ester carboxylesterase
MLGREVALPHLRRAGVRLHYREAGRGAPALVLIHGWGGSLEHWERAAAALRRTWRVVRVDLRGHGRSDAPAEGRYDVTGFADDVAWMIGRLGLRRPLVVGHSTGGLVALQLAVDRPAAVRAIAMVDSLISSETREALRRAPPRGLEQMFHPGFDRRVARGIARQAARLPPHVARPAAASVFAHDSTSALRALRVPALFIAADAGGRDPEQARRALDGTGVWFGQVVGSGHYAMLEVPEQVVAMLRRFLVSLRGRRAAAEAGVPRPFPAARGGL